MNQRYMTCETGSLSCGGVVCFSSTNHYDSKINGRQAVTACDAKNNA